MFWQKLKLFFKLSASSLIVEKDEFKQKSKVEKYKNSIKKAEKIIFRLKEEYGIPGVILGISVNGENIFIKGYGYSDVENLVKCNPQTVMRVASISKPITMTILAKLLDLKTLSLDIPIKSYIPKFPEKLINDEMVNINLRNIVSHLSGIRHYDKECKDIKPSNEKDKKKDLGSKTEPVAKKEFENFEYYLSTPYKSTNEAMEVFINDPLCIAPGSQFLYTTHGWTLIAGAIEHVTKEPFTKTLQKFFHTLGMGSTYIDENSPLIPHRSRYYVREKAFKDSTNYVIKNSRYVDNSYKWAGGGILSTVPDLLTFGLTMLYSYQHCSSHKDIPGLRSADPKPRGYLDCNTVAQLWTPIVKTAYKSPYVSHYGMGWFVYDPSLTNSHPHQLLSGQTGDDPDPPAKLSPESINSTLSLCRSRGQEFACFHHSGGAVGASSILAIFTKAPHRHFGKGYLNDERGLGEGEGKVGGVGIGESTRAGSCMEVEGVIVSILANLQEISLTKTAFEIGKLFIDDTRGDR